MIKSFDQFLNENTHKYSHANKKDIERAEGLEWRGKTFSMREDFLLSNATRMSKSIKDRNKILGRFEAVMVKWGPFIAAPFAYKLIELWGNDSEYSKAWSAGVSDSSSLSPGRGYGSDDVIANYIYNVAFYKNRR
jgi:hypothetical protein